MANKVNVSVSSTNTGRFFGKFSIVFTERFTRWNLRRETGRIREQSSQKTAGESSNS